MKVIQKTFAYCLKPTKTQKAIFAQHAGTARFIFNWGLSQIKGAMDAKEPIPKYQEIAHRLTELKRQEDKEWLKDINAQVLQQSLKDLERALSFFFEGKKKKRGIGFPRYKSKGVKDSFRFPQYVKCNDGKVYLPKIGWVAYRDSRSLEGEIKQAVVKRKGDRWFIYIVCNIELAIVPRPFNPETAVGIDVGIKELAVLSNGQVFENLHFLKKDIERIKRAQKAHARKQKGSKNRKKSAKRLGRMHEKITNKRKDYLHKISTIIVESQDTIIVEKLRISSMIKNHKLAQSIADASWRELLSNLKYKADWRGKNYLEIPQFTPTSKTCFSCKSEQDMPLSVRIYDCKNCGFSIDRDLNAAMNIKAVGTIVLACGEMGTGPLNEAGRFHGF